MHVKTFMKWFYEKQSPYVTFDQIKSEYGAEAHDVLDSVSAFFEVDSKGDVSLNRKYTIGHITIKRTIAFLLTPESKSDIPVDLYDLNGAMENDLVLVNIATYDPFIVDIIESDLKKLICDVKKRKDGKVFFESKDADYKLIVVKNAPDYLVDGHVVFLDVIEVTKTEVITKFREVIGHKNDPDMAIVKIVYDYEWPLKFSNDVLDELNQIKVDATHERNTRRDLRDKFIVTIDGADAKDLDDAISLEVLENGHYKLGVHIADVSYFVKAGSLLDTAAYARATSVYLADRVIPMIPHGLSNDLCSLNPNEDKYTITCEMILNKDIEVLSYEIFSSIIQSKKRLTYDAVNSLLNEHISTGEKRLDDMLFSMNEIASKLKQIRNKRGAIDFESSELKFKLDISGNVLSVEERKTDKGEALIESFMILANEVVAKHFYHNDLPGIYRVHEKPALEKLEIALQNTSKLGFKADTKSSSTAQTLQRLTKQVVDSPYEYIINMILLRSMQKAKYSEKPIGHFGLASPYYSHFTSPIRRYPDLLLHRMIRDLILNKPNETEFIKIKEYYEDLLPSYSEHTSENERLAINMEREVNKLKSRQYMEAFIGKSFNGQIVSMMPSGFFVKLDNGIEGFVNVRNVNQYLMYDDMQLLFYTNHGIRYKLGDQIRVKLIKVDEVENNIDFTIDSKNKAEKYSPIRTTSKARSNKKKKTTIKRKRK